MSAVGTKTDYTPEDLLAMPDGKQYELVNGFWWRGTWAWKQPMSLAS